MGAGQAELVNKPQKNLNS